MTSDNNQEKEPKMEWYVMRDLHRGHSKVFAYEELAQKGFRTYTPTIRQLSLSVLIFPTFSSCMAIASQLSHSSIRVRFFSSVSSMESVLYLR